MKIKKIVLTDKMRDIMGVLYLGRNMWQTTNRIAKESKVCWMTARAKLKQLHINNKIDRKRKNGRTYWRIQM